LLDSNNEIQNSSVEALRGYPAHDGAAAARGRESGRQFTGAAFTDVLIDNSIAVGMDGKRARRDNVIVERL
jgi:putative transposase